MAETVEIVVHDRNRQAATQAYDIILAALREVFENDILNDARALSPVGDDPVRPGSKRNRDSIEVKVFGTKKGPFAKIFTTSGHGGFLEVGTSKMGAQPYIYPAMQKNISKLVPKIQEGIAAADKKANGKD